MNPALQEQQGGAAEYVSDRSSASVLLRRLFPFYCALAALVTFGYAVYDPFQLDGDAVAYMDLGDYLRAHQWAAIVNGYWHPIYPAFLSLGYVLFHSTRANELLAYYMVNFGIFLLEMLAIVLFTDALVRLRDQGAGNREQGIPGWVLGRYALRYLGLALLVIASQRELSMGKIRPDALLQAFLLFGFAALLAYLRTGLLRWAALMGLALGCAFLTKSFAFVVTLLAIAAMVLFRWLWQRIPLARVLPGAALAFVCFAVVAGPYMAALSRQHGRLDFGDSGSLNYAWYVGGTEKMHLQPYMTDRFGSAEVHLKHPEKELMRSPQVLSYAAFPYGTYPDWFDATYWNDRVKPHFNLGGELRRFSRNCVLVVRYLFNHPEGPILLVVLLALGGRVQFGGIWGERRHQAFWIAPVALGVAIWGTYAVVNTEERYVTVAYLTIVLSIFAMLRDTNEARLAKQSARAMVVLLALLAAGESLRIVLENRRTLAVAGIHAGWYSPEEVHAAEAIRSMGLQPGDAVACAGYWACLGDPYWARLAGVRILYEIYDPYAQPAYEFLSGLPNREQAIAVVRAQGAKVLVADFADAPVTADDPAFRHWRRLGDTTLYELPLNVPAGDTPKPPPARPHVRPPV